jgi:choline dehydrogenase-like flavoprotein
MRERFGRMLTWSIFAEDLPETHNRVELSDDVTDSSGLPAARVHYRISDNTRRMLDFHAARARESLEAAGATQIDATVPVRASGWHLLGTARMGTDPERSVVDRNLRVHDVPNLYIADGSTFVTSAGVNPTSTVAALAARLGDHLVRGGRDLEVVW